MAQIFHPSRCSNLVFLRKKSHPPQRLAHGQILTCRRKQGCAQTAPEDPEADCSQHPAAQAVLGGLSWEPPSLRPRHPQGTPGGIRIPAPLAPPTGPHHPHAGPPPPPRQQECACLGHAWRSWAGQCLATAGANSRGTTSGVRQACVHSEVTTSSHVARLPRRPGKAPCEQLLEPSRACSLPGRMWTPQNLGSHGRPSLQALRTKAGG